MQCQPDLKELQVLLCARGKLPDLGVVFQAENVGLLGAHVQSDGACQGRAPPECGAAPAHAASLGAGCCRAS